MEIAALLPISDVMPSSLPKRNAQQSLKAIQSRVDHKGRSIPPCVSQFGLEVKHTGSKVNPPRNHRAVSPVIHDIAIRSASIEGCCRRHVVQALCAKYMRGSGNIASR